MSAGQDERGGKMSEDRRAARRYVLWIPVQVDADDASKLVGVSRNASWSGILVMTGAKVKVGARVQLTFKVPDPLTGQAAERQVAGEIIRVQPNEADPDGLWRYELAVRFDQEVPDLAGAFEELEAKRPF